MGNRTDLEYQKFELSEWVVWVKTHTTLFWSEIDKKNIQDLETLKFNEDWKIRVVVTF